MWHNTFGLPFFGAIFSLSDWYTRRTTKCTFWQLRNCSQSRPQLEGHIICSYDTTSCYRNHSWNYVICQHSNIYHYRRHRRFHPLSINNNNHPFNRSLYRRQPQKKDKRLWSRCQQQIIIIIDSMNLKTLLDELLRSSSPSFASTLINNDWFLSQMSYHYIAERIRKIVLSHDGVDSTQVLPHHCMSWKNGFGRVIVHHHHWDALLIVLWWWSDYERHFHHTFRIRITFRHWNIVFCCPDEFHRRAK